MAANKTTEGPIASDSQKGHEQEILAYASYNGYLRYWFREKRNWLSNFANNVVFNMLSMDYFIKADGTTEKYLFHAMNNYVFILDICAGDVGNAYLEAYWASYNKV